MNNRTSIRRKHRPFRGNFSHGQNNKQFSANRRHHGPRVDQQQIQAKKYVNKAAVQAVTQEYVPQHTFADFQFAPILLSNITSHGYTTPTPIQDQAIPPAMQGHDIVGIANTGTGKTAAFLLPLLQKHMRNRRERTLIMAPTRELAVQIGDELKAFAQNTQVTMAMCIGGASMHNQIDKLKRQPDIIIGTPGRLKDLIERRKLDMRQFTNVVLDEVDRMVDIGFIKDIKMMLGLLPQQRQSFFFSATVTPDVAGIIQQFLIDPITISVKTQDTAETVDQDVIKVTDPSKKFETLTGLLRQDDFRKVIIFGRTKWGVEKLARNLEKSGFTSAAIHGNKSQGQRQQALTNFKHDKLQVLVATDIAARGLDIPQVSHVINYDEPATYEDYIHRIGRTGRANQRGKALTFVA